MALALISIGSNMNEPDQQVNSALTSLGQLPESELIASSRLFHTKPWGRQEQPDFVNAAAALTTTLEPLGLLDQLQQIEDAHGRKRQVKWGPRTLDLDIICYDQLQLNHPRLILPHPYFRERAFVLEPLSELFPNHLILEKPVQYWLNQLLSSNKN